MKSIINKLTRGCGYKNLEVGDSIFLEGWAETYMVTAIVRETENIITLGVKSNEGTYRSSVYLMDKRIGIQVIKK